MSLADVSRKIPFVIVGRGRSRLPTYAVSAGDKIMAPEAPGLRNPPPAPAEQ